MTQNLYPNKIVCMIYKDGSPGRITRRFAPRPCGVAAGKTVGDQVGLRPTSRTGLTYVGSSIKRAERSMAAGGTRAK